MVPIQNKNSGAVRAPVGPAPNPRVGKESMGNPTDKKERRAGTAVTEVKELLVLDPPLGKEAWN